MRMLAEWRAGSFSPASQARIIRVVRSTRKKAGKRVRIKK
jgi:hypothetical protein